MNASLSVQVFYILARCPYYKEGQREKDKTGIKRLLSNGTYTAAFPLHDVRHAEESGKHAGVGHITVHLHEHNATFRACSAVA